MAHYYDTTGKPCYTVPRADGKGERDTHIGDARKLGLVPSVTEYFRLLSKEGLNRWREENLLKAAFENKNKTTYEYWVKNVRQIVKQEQEKAPLLGTAIHDALEEYYKTGTYDGEYKKYVQSAILCIKYNIGDFNYIAENSFYHELGFGGKVDLHSEEIVLDFKTKDTDDIKKMKGYREHIMQLAAYREGLGIPNARCYNLFISTKNPDLVVLEEYSEEDLQTSWEMFKCLVKYWRLDNGFQ